MVATHGDESIGFLGLGALGAPIATNLLAAGKVLRVWNRTASKTLPLVQKGAKAVSKPSEAIDRGGVVFTILWDDASLEETVRGEGFLEALGPGGVHVSMTTVTPQTARAMATLHEDRGSTYVEAPIFGIPAQAVAGQLMVCLAGPDGAKQRVRPLLNAMGAARVFDFGKVIGAGTATKLAGNFMIISAFLAMQEAFDVLRASGVDPRPTLEMLTTTLLATPGNQRCAARLLGDQPTPASGIPLKDVGLFARLAEEAHRPVPLARQMREILAAAAALSNGNG
jgi:3-hydroxyisobutyrate dehydrogenase-like beta-hydroxyacid dehydrogenase